MKPESQILLRSHVLFEHTRRVLARTSLCVRKLAMTTAENYMASVPPEYRTVPFRWGFTVEELCKAERHNAQVITRYLDGTVKVLPVDLEDAWVMALPEPYRGECERDLARRRNTLAVRLVEDGTAGQAYCLARLMGEFGQLVEAVAPAMADGRITEADLPHLRRIIAESDDVLAAIVGLRQLALAGLSKDRT